MIDLWMGQFSLWMPVLCIVGCLAAKYLVSWVGTFCTHSALIENHWCKVRMAGGISAQY